MVFTITKENKKTNSKVKPTSCKENNSCSNISGARTWPYNFCAFSYVTSFANLIC